MPIFSYLATPTQGHKDDLMRDLNNLDHCEAIPAENEELIILVTEAPDPQLEKNLQKQLKELVSLQNLSMTYGHADQTDHN
jgi:nitrate reductase NapAB chaperone NapD